MKFQQFQWPEVNTAGSEGTPAPLWRRLIWMAGIWVVSVSALLAVAMVLRWVLKID